MSKSPAQSSRRAAVAVGALVAAAICGFAPTASAGIWEIERTSNLGNNNGGEMTRIYARFNENTGILRWEVDYADTVADGFTIAINDGPNPKGHAGELALIYFDATGAAPEVTAYAYNGQNTSTSYKDGNGEVSGNQAPDSIFAAPQKDSWASTASVESLGAGQRFILEMQVADIQGHSPLYPSGDDDWYGIGFAEKIGWWFHSYTGLQTSYDNGLLTEWSFDAQGWSDKAGMNTTLVPSPGPLALIGLAGLAASRRRR